MGALRRHSPQGGFREVPGALHHFLDRPVGLGLGFQKSFMGLGGLHLESLHGSQALLDHPECI